MTGQSPGWAVAGLFQYPALLVLVVLLPVAVIALILLRARDRQSRLARLGAPATVGRLLTAPIVESVRRRAALLGGAALLAGIAFAGPRWGTTRSVRLATGTDVAIAVDASLSMLANDTRPSRLERAKEEVRRLRALAPDDRIALLAFAGRSYILTPLTSDDGAIDLFLDNLDPSVVGQPGTSIAHAIRQAADVLLTTPGAGDRAIVILSDGEGFEDEAEVRHEAERAAANRISLVTVGFGTEAGSTIPLPPDHPGGAPTLKRDNAGQVVITHYTPQLLEAAAAAAHGTFIPAEVTDKADRIHRALAGLRTARRAVEEENAQTPRFALFLAAALLLLVIDTLIVELPHLARRTAPRLTFAAPRLAPSAAASLATIALIAAPPRPTHPPVPDSTAKTLTAYRTVMQRGDRSQRALYNYGTALLAADSIDGAESALATAANARDPELRYRALFNLGLAHLRHGLAYPPTAAAAATPDLDAALESYKRILLSHPEDFDAAWNYELALRRKLESSGGGGGGGTPSPANAGNSPSAAQSPVPQTVGALDQQQAQELLNSAAREEREVAGQSQKQNAAEEPPQGKDW